jgi:hypothetical protein
MLGSTLIRKTVFLLMAMSLSIGIMAQSNVVEKKPFEGVIRFLKVTLSDTLEFAYFVKGNKVKLVSYDKCIAQESKQEFLIFDLKKKRITAVKPTMRMYSALQLRPYVPLSKKEFRIIKSDNKKFILGHQCIQWRIKNLKENSEIAYWVNDDYNYSFFVPMLKLWNRIEKSAQYYLQISGNEGLFPFQSTERTFLRDFKLDMQVIKITEKSLPDHIFEIPKSYINYDQ